MRELKQHGFIDRLPNFIGVQASGCAPIAEAYASGNAAYTPAPPNSSSIAQSINNPAPPGGNILLKLIRQLKGSIISVSDEEIRSAQILLAQEEGLFCLPASATTLAGLLKLHGLNPFDPDKSIVLVLTGSGLKNIQVLDPKSMSIHTSALPGLDLLISKLIGNPKIIKNALE
jgi:threonine synthase